MRLESLCKKMQIGFLIFLLVIASACNDTDSETPQIAITVQSVQNVEENITNGYPIEEDASQGYPSNKPETVTSPGYPVPNPYENLLDEPPNPDIELPAASETGGVIGGVLIREVVEHGFEPLVPVSLSLADILLTTDGRPAFIRAGSGSPKAQLYPTGIFVFQNVPPGEYGLMVDVGYTQFPINNDDGTPLLIKLESGSVIDMGQVITELPPE